MFLPLHDDTPLHVIRFQWVTGVLMLVNVAIFVVLNSLLGGDSNLIAANQFGLVPQAVTAAGLEQGARAIPAPVTFLTYPFLHGGWMHLTANMLFLWVFADNVEDAFGHAAFLIFYILCGIGAGLAHLLAAGGSDAPLIGASGAVAGVMASYLVLFPKARVWILLFMRLPVKVPASWVLAGWIGLQLFSLIWSQGHGGEDVAWAAHVGGFATGLVLTLLLRARLVAPDEP